MKYNSVETPPDSLRDVMLLVDGNLVRGWWDGDNWKVYTDKGRPSSCIRVFPEGWRETFISQNAGSLKLFMFGLLIGIICGLALVSLGVLR